jgi:cathepsin A (carboxypeptidase C)
VKQLKEHKEMMKFLAVLAAFFALSSGLKLQDAPVTGVCDTTVKSLSGYFSVSETQDKNYFYWFFESRSAPSTDPLVIWLTGGPGCSSQLALLTENGPCKVSDDGLSTVNNPYSWNNNANILWVDQPSGVGYSYGVKVDHNETMVAEDMYHFVQEFVKAHPEYAKLELFIFGESYGGHYAPAVSHRIYKGNKNNEGVHINLAGVGVGNGLTDPVVQYQYYPEMAMNNSYGIKTVSEEAYAKMVKHVPACTLMGAACQLSVEACEYAYTFCNLMETTPYYNTGLNPYDIRKPCGDNALCYNFTNIETFLNLPSTREALHVSEKVDKWESCNTAVDIMFMSDWMRNFQRELVDMLEDGVRVLIYAGDVDFICNWIGNKAWTMNLAWSGKGSFTKEEDHSWKYGDSNKEGGKVRTGKAVKGHGSLTFLQVFEAGHMVPMDQPEAALSLLNTFLQNHDFY